MARQIMPRRYCQCGAFGGFRANFSYSLSFSSSSDRSYKKAMRARHAKTHQPRATTASRTLDLLMARIVEAIGKKMIAPDIRRMPRSFFAKLNISNKLRLWSLVTVAVKGKSFFGSLAKRESRFKPLLGDCQVFWILKNLVRAFIVNLMRPYSHIPNSSGPL